MPLGLTKILRGYGLGIGVMDFFIICRVVINYYSLFKLSIFLYICYSIKAIFHPSHVDYLHRNIDVFPYCKAATAV